MLRKTSRRQVKKIPLRTKPGLGPGERSTLSHLSNGGLPLNPVLLEKIIDGLDSGAYAEDREGLIQDIKTDPGLMVHCLRTIHNQAPGTNPIEQLQVLEEEKLRSVLPEDALAASPHRMTDMLKFQALRLQHKLISTQTAEALAENSLVSSDIAYAVSFFNQLGLDLIAWNYPSIYSKALTRQRRGEQTLEKSLSEMLGIAPKDISRHLAKEWTTDPTLQSALRTLGGDPSGVETALTEICQTANMYAESKDSTTYPRAQKRWTKHESPYKKRVETELKEHLACSLERIISIHSTTSPILEKLPAAHEKALQKRIVNIGAEREAHNRLVAACPRYVRQQFQQMYKLIEANGISLDAIRCLTDDILPSLGFTRGCLYMLQETEFNLVPALRVGSEPLANYERFLRGSGRGLGNVINRFTPIKTEGLGIQGQLVTYVSAALNHQYYPGVLYLEINDNVVEDPSYDALLYFKAARQALQDCFQ